MFNFNFGRKTEKTPVQEYASDRLAELVGDNSDLELAIKDYSRLQQQISFGSATAEDRTLVEEQAAKITEILAADGKALSFEAASHSDMVDDSMRNFIQAYQEMHQPEALAA